MCSISWQGFGDDTASAFTLPFSLPFPGGSTSSVTVCSNGWVTSGSYSGGSNYTPVVGTFLNNEMWCAMWRDLNPSAGGDVYFDSNSEVDNKYTWLKVIRKFFKPKQKF